MLRSLSAAVVAVVGLGAAEAGAVNGATLFKSGPIQITGDGAAVWAVNPDHDSVSRLTTASAAVAQFALPGPGPHSPRGLAIVPGSGEVWVAARASDRVFVLDPASGAVLATLSLPHGSGPMSVAVSPDGLRALVALHASAQVAVYDVPSRTLVKVIGGMHRRPWGITFISATGNGGEAWVSHTITDGEDSLVTRLDLSTLTVASIVPLKSVNPKSPGNIPNDPVPIPEGGYTLLRGHIAKPPGINQVWLPLQYQNFHNTTFTPDSTVQASLHKINLVTSMAAAVDDRVVFTAVYAHQNNNTLVGPGWDAKVSGPVDLAFDQAGATAFLVCAQSNDVLVFPTNIGLARPTAAPPLTEIGVGENPLGIATCAATNKAYVLNSLSRDVSVINLDTKVEEARIPITPGTPEPLPANFLKGAKLFNTAADPRLSANGKIACASCHPNGDSDGLLWSFAQLGAGVRKTLHLKGLGHSFGPPFNGKGQLHRGGDRDEVQDFEFTARSPVMGGAGFLASPNPALGPAPNAGLNPDLDAIASYLLNLPAEARSPLREPGGSLREAALRGAGIFKKAGSGSAYAAGCIACHSGPDFTDRKFWNASGHAPSPEHQGPLFNTPSLIGMWDNAPHVQVTGFGDSETLGGVLRKAKNGLHGNTSGLNRTHMRDLEAFLNALDRDLAQAGIGALADTDPPRVVAVRPVRVGVAEVIFSETVDAGTAGNPAHYAFTDGVGTFPATSVVVDASWGNRVRVSAPWVYEGCAVTYTLVPGPIQDVAGAIAGGANNVLDVNDPANRVSFQIDGTITVTFGDSGLETFPSVTHDASFVAGLSDVSLDAVRLYPASSPETRGFLSFDFVPTLTGVCGVTSPTALLDASFTLQPSHAHRRTVEFRRCLMPWGDPPNDWCFGCPGAVTRNHAKHTSIPWHQNGAAAKGGGGTTPAEYYPTGAFDTALTIDATATPIGLDQPVEVSGAMVLDAFRFWLANPTLNFGYAAEVAGNTGGGIEFWGAEFEDGVHAVVLSLTFTLQPTPGLCDCYADCNADSSLTVADYTCFQARFVAGDPYADCNQSGTLTIADFICFQSAFVAGCP